MGWLALLLSCRIARTSEVDGASIKPLKDNLVLLLHASTPPVGCYPHAIVTAVKTCADGIVRSVTDRTIDGCICTRDICKIVLIEMQNSKDNDTQNKDGDRDIPIHDKLSCAMRLDNEDEFD